MRIFAIHDTAGNISEVVTSPDDLPQPMLRTEPGLSMTEIELPKDLVETDLESSEGLAKFIEHHRVRVVSAKATVVSHD